MPTKAKQLNDLFALYVHRQCTSLQEAELMQLLADPALEEEKERLIDEYYDSLPEQFALPKESADEIFNEITGRQKSVRHTSLIWWRNRMVRMAAAAVLLLCAGAGIYVWLSKDPKRASVAAAQSKTAKPDIAPGGNKATLTLSNGKVIVLDSAANGKLAEQGSVTISKQGSGIVYDATHSPLTTDHSPSFNTIATPRGGQYQLTLPDGSKVWLNAASSITYPVTFTGNERKVTIAGEAYFEVAKDKNKPFYVKANDMTVEVLGTHFNVMAYNDEAVIKTTLTEGKVKVIQGSKSALILPGKQAKVNAADKSIAVTDADIDKELAWKNGLFDFENDNIKDVMRQLSRWYDVDIEYTANVTDEFYTGAIRRQVNLSQVLNMLESTGGNARFAIEDKKILVKSR